MSYWKLPRYSLTVRKEQEAQFVYDPIRKDWFVFQPEEEVRQHLIRFLLEEKGVSKNLLAVEKEIIYRETRRRFDLVIYNREGTPEMLCECKAPSVPINQNTVNQIARYNTILKAPHLLITNGRGLVVFSVSEAGTFMLNQEW